MRIKSILFLLICFLLSCSFTLPLLACECDPVCEGCESCEAGVCVDDDDNCSTCKECDDGDCVLKSTSDCDVDSDCPGECESCNSCSCEDDNSKCADCMTCVAGDCADIQCYVLLGECQRCNETTGECEYSCSDEGCGEICVDNECVPDCNSVGSTCNWTKPPVQSGCPGTHIEDLSCAPGVTGLTCDWELVESYSNSATGPCKVSGGFCATYEPVKCKDKFIPTLGMVCGCTGTPALIYYEYRTARYKCPGDAF